MSRGGIRQSARVACGIVATLALCVGCSDGHARSDSTLDRTLRDRNGDGILESAPGEPLVDRTELAPSSKPTQTIALFGQLTDAHVVDEESPARVEPLDRLGAPFTSAFRPQESLSGQVLDAAVIALNRLHPQAVVESGDLIDNAQANELDEALAVLRGGRVDPNSGGPGYRGVQQASDPDPFYYRPDVDPPRHPGLLAAAERPFRSPGLQAPWYPLVGNHDVLVQGNLAPSAETEAVAHGSRKLVRLNHRAAELARRRVVDPETFGGLLRAGGGIRIPPDPRRRELQPEELVSRLRRASGIGGRGPLLDYTFDIGRSLRGIVLDTARRGAGSEAIVRPAQIHWLRTELAHAGRRWIVVFSHQPLPPRALSVLDGSRRVVAAVWGHTHRNSIVPRRTDIGGYWLISTASLIDFPQQVRALRLARTADGGVVLQTWLLNTDPTVRLAEIARQLAFDDYQGGRPQRFAGTRGDRNASLYVRTVTPP